MSFQLVQMSPEDLDSTIDEDLLLSCQITRLPSTNYKNLFAEAAKSLTETGIKKYDSGELDKSAPFGNRRSFVSTTVKSELTEIKSLCFADVLESKQYAKSDPSIMKGKRNSKGALKSTEKSKYLQWHNFLLERTKRGIPVEATLRCEKTLVAPYFIYGDEKACEKWDQSRWKEEEEWWEDDQWNSDSPTYAKYKDGPVSPRDGFGAYVHYLEGKGS